MISVLIIAAYVAIGVLIGALAYSADIITDDNEYMLIVLVWLWPLPTAICLLAVVFVELPKYLGNKMKEKIK